MHRTGSSPLSRSGRLAHLPEIQRGRRRGTGPIKLPAPMTSPAPASNEVDASASLAKTPMLLFIRGFGLVLFAVGLVASLHYYLGARLIRDAGISGGAAAALWTALALLFLSIPVGFAAGRFAPRPMAKALHWVSHLWLGAFGLLLTTVAFADAVTFVLARAFPNAAWGRRGLE